MIGGFKSMEGMCPIACQLLLTKRIKAIISWSVCTTAEVPLEGAKRCNQLILKSLILNFLYTDTFSFFLALLLGMVDVTTHDLTLKEIQHKQTTNVHS